MKSARVPFVSSFASRFAGGTFQYRRAYIEEYQNWVYACVNARAEEVANIELVLYRGDQIITEHPLLDILAKVNPFMTKHELFEATQSYKDLDGNAFWYLARNGTDGTGDIQEIYVLRPDKVSIIQDPTNGLMVKGYVFTGPDGQKIPFQPSEILHHKTFNPLNYSPYPGRGMGVVEAAYSAVSTDNEAREWNLQFFRNGAKPDGVLTVPGEGVLDPDDFNRIQAEWDSEHKGSANSHKISILQGGVKWEETTRTQTDMDFYNGRTFSRDEILAIFRVPKSIIGITDDVNRANAVSTIFVFALRTVKPLMQRLVDTLNEFLVPEYGDDLRLDFVSPVAEDRLETIAEYTAGYGKWLSRNDIRVKEGMSPTENGDEFFDLISMVPVDNTIPDPKKAVRETTAKEVAPKKAKKGKKSAAEVVIDKALKGGKLHTTAKASMPAATKRYSARALTPLAREKYIDMWKVHFHTSTNGLKASLDTYFTAQEKEVHENVRQELKGLTKKEIKYKSATDMLFDKSEAVGAGISLITPYLRDYLKGAGENATVLVGGTSFDSKTASIEAFIKQRAKYFSDSVNDTTAEDLVRSINEGMDAGESTDEIQQRVSDVYGIAKDSRAVMIARTEVAASSNAGATQAYLQAGITQQEWAVVNPEDEDCLENDGDVETIGDAFPSGDDAPPVHPNCQCTLLPVFDDEESDDSE